MELLLSITKETWYIVIGTMMGAICALHILSALSSGLISKIEQYADIFLHILLFAALLFMGAAIEVTVLLFTVSLFAFVAVRFVRYELSLKNKSVERMNTFGGETKNDL